MGVPPELAEEQDPIRMVGSTMFSTWIFQDSMSGATYIDMVAYSMSLLAWGLLPQWLTTSCSHCIERWT